jgi:hypothetical protein
MLCKVSNLVDVDCSLGLVVLLYSHNRMTKKNAQTIKWEHVNDKESLLFENIWTTLLITEIGTAFCCFSFGTHAL